jgi:hypothetical protein
MSGQRANLGKEKAPPSVSQKGPCYSIPFFLVGESYQHRLGTFDEAGGRDIVGASAQVATSVSAIAVLQVYAPSFLQAEGFAFGD